MYILLLIVNNLLSWAFWESRPQIMSLCQYFTRDWQTWIPSLIVRNWYERWDWETYRWAFNEETTTVTKYNWLMSYVCWNGPGPYSIYSISLKNSDFHVVLGSICTSDFGPFIEFALPHCGSRYGENQDEDVSKIKTGWWCLWWLTMWVQINIKGGQQNFPVFFGRLFRQTSNVDILETVCSNDLKFEVRIVLDRVPLQIKF